MDALRISGAAMRVAFDARSLGGNHTGVGTYAANLIGALLDADARFSPVLISTEIPESISWAGNERVRTRTRPNARWNNFLWSNVSLRAAIGQSQIDLFHAPGYTKPLGLGVPSIVTLHDVSYAAAKQWYPYSSGFLRQIWYRKSAISADAILTVSEFSRREIIRVYPVRPDHVYSIYPGVDHRRFFPNRGSEGISELASRYGVQQGFLLFVGDIHARRNIGRIIEALHEVKRSNAAASDLELVVIGRVLESTGAEKHQDVRYLGYIPDSDLPLFYNAARMLVYPSFYEGFGFPIVEAMACGCPVVVSRGTACEEVAGDAGLKVDPASVQSIMKAITTLIENHDLSAKCVESGLARAGQFQWRRTAEQTLEVYGEVIKSTVASTI
jgi:glycosyltransferase involved in cell wall biosynthesis